MNRTCKKVGSQPSTFRIDLNLFRYVLGSSLWDTAPERRGTQENLLVFKNHPVPSQQVGKQTRATGGLCGWARSSLLNLDMKWNYVWIGSRDKKNKRRTELLFDLARIGIRKAKADMELGQARVQKCNKKWFYKYMSIKKKTKENISLQLNGNKWCGKGQGTNFFLPQCLTGGPAFRSLILLRLERKLRKEALLW